MTSQEYSELSNKLDTIEKTLNKINNKAGFRVEWQDKKTDSDITLAGNATVARTGTLIGTFGIPASPTQLILMLVVKADDGTIHSFNAGEPGVKILDN